MKKNREFLEFMSEADERPPAIVSERIFQRIHADIDPDIKYLLIKIFSAHIFASVLSLAFCPQFGIRSFGEGHGLMYFFMSLGTYGCYIACGAFYLSSSVLTLGFLLSKFEFIKLYKNRWLMIPLLTSLSLGFFFMWGEDVLLGISVAWFLGALGFGVLAIEVSKRLKNYVSF